MSSPEVTSLMEVDLTMVPDHELDYWCKEFPELTRDMVADILECVNIGDIKETYWSGNPSLEESVVNQVVASNAIASYEYHIYNTFNNEAQ